jgi:hypothetical protein
MMMVMMQRNVIVGLLSLPSLMLAMLVDMPLPPDLTAMNSTAGISLLLDAHAQNQAVSYWQLSIAYTTQVNQAFCSVASSAMVLNALGVPAPESAAYKPHPYYTQDNVFNNCAASANITYEVVEHHGLELAQAAQLLSCQSHVKAVAHYASDSSLEQLEASVRQTVKSQDSYIIINFNRTGLHEVMSR